MRDRMLVLGWHNVDPTPAFPAAPGEGRRVFGRQLRALARHTTVCSLPYVLDLMDARAPLPSRCVVLTFDDGYRDNLDLAVPALDREGLSASFFLVPGFLSGTHRVWWEELAAAFRDAAATELTWDGHRFDLRSPADRRAAHDAVLPALKRVDHDTRLEHVDELRDRLDAPIRGTDGMFLDWAGARDLRDTGHHIGSHTVRHPILSRETADAQRHELADSRRTLENELGIVVDTFAYPNGTVEDYDADTLAGLGDAGYRCAVTTRLGLADRRHDPYEIRRAIIGPTTDVWSVARHAWWAAKDRTRATVASVRAGAPS